MFWSSQLGFLTKNEKFLSRGKEASCISDNMVLYYKPTCPFCHKVLAFMEQEDIAMPMRDTLEPGVKDDLIRIAGKGQVPCLIVDGVPMFESDDIIRFLGDLILEREEG